MQEYHKHDKKISSEMSGDYIRLDTQTHTQREEVQECPEYLFWK